MAEAGSPNVECKDVAPMTSVCDLIISLTVGSGSARNLLIKLLFSLLGLSVAGPSVYGGGGIPKELVGEWRVKDETGSLVLILREDGVSGIGGTVGAAGIASYDPESQKLTMSIRHDRTGAEVFRMTWQFSPKSMTLTQREKGKEVFYRKHSNQVPEPFKSLDVNKIFKPKE